MKTTVALTMVLMATSSLVWGQAASFDPVRAAASIFDVVDVPNPDQFNDLLDAVSGSSPTDLWAVGDVALHYDGTSWTPFPTALIDGINTCSLTGVATVSPTNAWAVGTFNNAGRLEGVIEHWDGMQWTRVDDPFTPGQSPLLFGIAATSASNIWAVGGYIDSSTNTIQPLFVHYDGTQWTQVSGPFVNSVQTILQGISALSANDIYVVGYSGFQNDDSTTFVEHWDGNIWKVLTSPNLGTGPNQLNGVVAVANNDVWAAGFWVSVAPPQEAPRQTLLEHWDGTKWRVVKSPNTGHGQFQSNQLYGMTAASSKNVWAYGSAFLADGSNQQQTLVLHWNGAKWIITPSPSPKKSNFMSDVLFGGVVTRNGNLYIVGSQDDAPTPILGTLVLHARVGR